MADTLMTKENCSKGSIPKKGVLILAATGGKQIQNLGLQKPALCCPNPGRACWDSLEHSFSSGGKDAPTTLLVLL